MLELGIIMQRQKSKTKVVHCKKEPYDVYIGRPSKFGNPFKRCWCKPKACHGDVIVEYLEG